MTVGQGVFTLSGGTSVYDGRFIHIQNTDTTTNLNTALTTFDELFGVATNAYDVGLFTPNFGLGVVTVLEAGLYSIHGYAALVRGTGSRLTLGITLTLNTVTATPQYRDNYMRGLGGANFSGQAIPYFEVQLAINDTIGVERESVGGAGTFFLDGTLNYFRMTKIM